MPEPRYRAADLADFAASLLARAGASADRARTIAGLLLEADLMGHTTHGLQLLAPYLKEIAEGKMRTSGEVDVVADRGAAVTWDGRRLPGPGGSQDRRRGRVIRDQAHTSRTGGP